MDSDKKLKGFIPKWVIVAPVLAWIGFFTIPYFATFKLFPLLLAILLISVVLAAVHHAEVVAYRVGEPFGTLILALSITIIEVALIITIMAAGGEGTTTLARDTVFAAVMLILTGMIGICILVGSFRYKVQVFTLQGISSALITLTAIISFCLILPNYTTSKIGAQYNHLQLIVIALVCLILYISFVLFQTFRHRAFFLPPSENGNKDLYVEPPTLRTASISMLFLIACLGIVVLLAKKLAPDIEYIVFKAGAPKALVGIIIALVILLPEGLAAYRAARKNLLQTSLNLAMGSALASIGLTIPTVSLLAVFMGIEITLGIDMKSTVLLLLSLFTIMLSLATGRTNLLQGVVLLMIFVVYFFITIIP